MPFNKGAHFTSTDDLFFSGSNCKVQLGDSELTFIVSNPRSTFVPLAIDGMPFIAFELVDRDLFLSMEALGQNASPVFEIRRNKLRVGIDLWDYDREGRRLKIRLGKCDIFLDLSFDPPGGIIIRRARILRNGIEVAVLGNAIVLLNSVSVVGSVRISGCDCGVSIGEGELPGITAIRLGGIPRGPFDRAMAVRKARSDLKGRPAASYILGHKERLPELSGSATAAVAAATSKTRGTRSS